MTVAVIIGPSGHVVDVHLSSNMTEMARKNITHYLAPQGVSIPAERVVVVASKPLEKS